MDECRQVLSSGQGLSLCSCTVVPVDTCRRLAQDWAYQRSLLDVGVAHEASPHPKELLVVNGFWERRVIFLVLCPL